MKLKLVAPLLGIVLAMSMSCKKTIDGEGPSNTETRAVNGFTGLSVQVPAQVEITQEQDFKLTIEAQQNILGIIKTYVNDGELRIKFSIDKEIGSHDNIRIKVSAPLYKSLTIHGSGGIKAVNTLETPSLKLVTHGSAGILIPSASVEGLLLAETNGSGNIDVREGSAGTGTLTSNGSANIDASDVDFTKVTALVRGSGNIKASVSELLKVQILGSGSVFYKGNAAIDVDIKGSGTVKKM